MTLAAAVTAALACSGQQSVSLSESSRVRGATFRLRVVDGASLPTRFTPLEDPQPAPPVQLDSGQITFRADGRATGEWYGTNGQAVVSRVFESAYVEEGTRVLVGTGNGEPPDTAYVSNDTITVRAQFFRPTSRERYVVVMTYTR